MVSILFECLNLKQRPIVFVYLLFMATLNNTCFLSFSRNDFCSKMVAIFVVDFSCIGSLELKFASSHIASGVSISFLMLAAIFDHYPSDGIAVFTYFAWAITLYLIYRQIIPDLFILAGLCFSAIVVITSFFGYHLFKGNNDPIGSFFFLTIIVIALAAAAAKWLKFVQKEMAA